MPKPSIHRDTVCGEALFILQSLRENGRLAHELSAEDFERRIRGDVSEAADAETAEALLQAVPPEQQWAGLDRYWSKSKAG